MSYQIDESFERLAQRQGRSPRRTVGLTQAIDLGNMAQPSLYQNLVNPATPSDSNANSSWHGRRVNFEQRQEALRQQIAEHHEKSHPTIKVADHVPVVPRNYQGATVANTGNYAAPNVEADATTVRETFELLSGNEEFRKLYARLSVSDSGSIVIDADSDSPIYIRNADHAFINHCVQHYSRLFEDELFPLTNQQFFSSLSMSLYRDVSTDDFVSNLKKKVREKNVSSDDFILDLKDRQLVNLPADNQVVKAAGTPGDVQVANFAQLPDLASKTTVDYIPPTPKASAYANYASDVDISALAKDQ